MTGGNNSSTEKRVPSGALLMMGLALVLALIFGMAIPQFATVGNLIEVLRQTTILGTLAIGVTFVVIVGRLDLSVGALLSVCAIVAVQCENRFGTVAAVLGALIVGGLVGVVNALLVARWRLNSLVSTLAIMSILQGALMATTGGRIALVADPDGSFLAVLGRESLFGVPISVFLLAGLVVGSQFLLARTPFGRCIQAVGANEMASAYSGIPTRWIVAGAYILSGVLAGVAALLFAGRVMAAQTDSGADLEIYALAGIILGGTSLAGGTGGVVRSLVGVLLLALIQNALVLLGLPYYIQWLCIWVALIFAVWADVATKRGKLWV